MIRAPDELRDVSVGATANLFVSVGGTSRRLKGTVDTIRERGANGEVIEVRIAEETPGTSEAVFRLGVAEGATYLLPMDVEGDDVVYVRYRRDGGRTGLYVDEVRDVSVRPPAPSPSDRSTAGSRPSGESPLGSENERRSRR